MSATTPAILADPKREIVGRLLEQRTAIEENLQWIDRMLVHARNGGGNGAEAGRNGKHQMSPEGRARISEAAKDRHAREKADKAAGRAPAKSARNMTEEGRARIQEAQRRRWDREKGRAAAKKGRAARG